MKFAHMNSQNLPLSKTLNPGSQCVFWTDCILIICIYILHIYVYNMLWARGPGTAVFIVVYSLQWYLETHPFCAQFLIVFI